MVKLELNIRNGVGWMCLRKEGRRREEKGGGAGG